MNFREVASIRTNRLFKSIACILAAIVMFYQTVQAGPALPVISADAAIVIEANRGQVLYEKLSGKVLHVSVACKIMTALIATEKAKLDAKVTISKESTGPERSTPNLEIGEKYSVEELLYAMMLSPANGASNAVAEYVGGDIKKFVDIMNNKAKELNMKDTNFVNPSGLYDPNQHTTAYDLALLVKYAISKPAFNDIFSTRATTWNAGNKSQLLVNSNKLFWSYDGVDGGKTGYNEKAMQSVVTTVTRDRMRLICIVLDAPENSVFNDSIKLFDYGFANYKSGVLVHKGQVLNTIDIGSQQVNLVSPNDEYYTFPLGDSYINSIDFSNTKNISLPVTRDKVLGVAKYALKDNTIINIDLYPDRDIYASSKVSTMIYNRLMENKDIFTLIVLLAGIEALLLISFISKSIWSKIKNKQV